MTKLKKLVQQLSVPDKLLLILIFTYLILGTFLIRTYGEGWDNVLMYQYGMRSFEIYLRPFAAYTGSDYGPSDLRYFGPFIVTTGSFLTKLLESLGATWSALIIFRYVYFLSHLMGIVFFYYLCKRLVSNWVALVTTLLYITQPLLFGHALINPKDTPFNAFFIATVFTGLLMVDELTATRIHWKARIGKAILAGVFLGLSISIRILGLHAAALVLMYFLTRKAKQKPLVPLIAYTLSTLIATYLSWPYLWASPIHRFIKSIKVNFGHEHHTSVLFNGQLYPSNALPKGYLPVLISIQFTEPSILLASLGIMLIVFLLLFWGYLNHRSKLSKRFVWVTAPRTPDGASALLLFLWIGLPILASMVLSLEFHDNFRHLLFVTPPLFIFAGIFLDFLTAKIKTRWISLLLVAIILWPGIFNIIKLHPYEYVYFNSFAGGVEGASQQFWLDYMGVSLKESFDFINETAEPGATVLVFGPVDVAQSYARPDLVLLDRFEHPDYVATDDQTYFVTVKPEPDSPDRPLLYQVTVDHTVLGSVHLFTK
jgi:hypothetical protein